MPACQSMQQHYSLFSLIAKWNKKRSTTKDTICNSTRKHKRKEEEKVGAIYPALKATNIQWSAKNKLYLPCHVEVFLQ